MRMSTKGRFAVTAMMEVALRERGGPVSLSGIGARQNMSLSYLEQLFSRLRRHGLVESTRGPGGGYTLGRRAEDITVADIVVAVDTEGEDAPRGEQPGGGREAAGNLTGELWRNLNLKMIEYMDTVTLRSLVDEQLAKGVQVEAKPAKRGLVAKISQSAGLRITAPNSVFACGRSFAPAS